MTLRPSGCRVAAAARKGLPGVRRHRRALVIAALSGVAISLTLLAGLATAARAPITAYVTNSGSNSVTPIDLATNTPGAQIKAGRFPGWVAITPDGKTAYVTDLESDSVTPIDLATNTPGAEIKVGVFPEGIAITPDGKTAYVANVLSDSVIPIDLATNKPGTEIEVNEFPIGIAITPPKPTPMPTNKEQCKRGGWHELADRDGTPFKNQGACVSYVASGGS
jgi:YVTN family beta-propeller protein